MGGCAGRRDYGEIVSQPLLFLLMWAFSHFFRPVEIMQLLVFFFFFPGKVVAYVAVGLVCLCLWEKVGSGSSFGPTLTQN